MVLRIRSHPIAGTTPGDLPDVDAIVAIYNFKVGMAQLSDSGTSTDAVLVEDATQDGNGIRVQDNPHVLTLPPPPPPEFNYAKFTTPLIDFPIILGSVAMRFKIDDYLVSIPAVGGEAAGIYNAKRPASDLAYGAYSALIVALDPITAASMGLAEGDLVFHPMAGVNFNESPFPKQFNVPWKIDPNTPTTVCQTWSENGDLIGYVDGVNRGSTPMWSDIPLDWGTGGEAGIVTTVGRMSQQVHGLDRSFVGNILQVAIGNTVWDAAEVLAVHNWMAAL